MLHLMVNAALRSLLPLSLLLLVLLEVSLLSLLLLLASLQLVKLPLRCELISLLLNLRLSMIGQVDLEKSLYRQGVCPLYLL